MIVLLIIFFIISQNLKIKVDVKRNDKIDSKTIIKKKYNKIVISPGPGNPDQAGKLFKNCQRCLQTYSYIRVCLGHQIIAQVFGGKIIQAKNLMHGKVSKIKHKKRGFIY